MTFNGVMALILRYLSEFVCDVIVNKNSSGDEIANVNFFYNIAHVEASAYAH